MSSGVQYRCVGLLRLDEATQRAIIDEEAPLAQVESYAAEFKVRHLQDEEEWSFRLRVARSRSGCGRDLTEVIEALPEDGVEYTVVCSDCGNKVAVRRDGTCHEG